MEKIRFSDLFEFLDSPMQYNFDLTNNVISTWLESRYGISIGGLNRLSGHEALRYQGVFCIMHWLIFGVRYFYYEKYGKFDKMPVAFTSPKDFIDPEKFKLFAQKLREYSDEAEIRLLSVYSANRKIFQEMYGLRCGYLSDGVLDAEFKPVPGSTGLFGEFLSGYALGQVEWMARNK